MTRKRKIYEAGEPLPIRLKTNTPQFLMDKINEILANEGNAGILDVFLEGLKKKMADDDEGLFIPLPPGMKKEELEKIKDNEKLLILLGQIALASTSFKYPFPTNILQTSSNHEAVEPKETKEESKTEPSIP
jgi:hypothetical protein